MKSKDSRLFCEAFFVLREDAPPTREEDMLAEANRILDEHLFRGRKKLARPLALALSFLLGAVGAAVVFSLLFFL